MTTLPTESVLNWSSEKPTFEEVKGKRLGILDRNHKYSETRITLPEDIDDWFDESFLSYAIIAEPLEAKELFGWSPEIMETVSISPDISPLYYARYVNKDGLEISMPYSDTEASAITAWNQLVDKIVGER